MIHNIIDNFGLEKDLPQDDFDHLKEYLIQNSTGLLKESLIMTLGVNSGLSRGLLKQKISLLERKFKLFIVFIKIFSGVMPYDNYECQVKIKEDIMHQKNVLCLDSESMVRSFSNAFLLPTQTNLKCCREDGLNAKGKVWENYWN